MIRLTHRNINRLIVLAALAAPIVYLFGGLIAGLVGAHGEQVYAEPASKPTAYDGMSYEYENHVYTRAVYGGDLIFPASLGEGGFVCLRGNRCSVIRDYSVVVDGFALDDTLTFDNSWYLYGTGVFYLEFPDNDYAFANSTFVAGVVYDINAGDYVGFVYNYNLGLSFVIYPGEYIFVFDEYIELDYSGIACCFDFNPSLDVYPLLANWRSLPVVFEVSGLESSFAGMIANLPLFSEPINGINGTYVDDIFGQFFTHDNWLSQVGRMASAGETPAYGFAPIGTFINYMDANLLHFYANDVGWAMLCYGYFYYSAHVMLLDLAFYMVTFIVRIIKAVVEKMEGGLGV